MTEALLTEATAVPKDRNEALGVLDRLRAGEALLPQELDFRGVSLPGADLSGLQLSGANFTDADLSGADLSGATLFKATCVGISLMGANLQGAEFSGADLSRGNLQDAKAARVGLGMACLQDARLFSTHLEEATLTKADLQGADVRCAVLKGARIREADLRKADFTAAELKGADLSLSRLDGAAFNNADLRDTRLRAIAGFEEAEWLGADIRDINFAGAYRMRRHIVDENYLWEFKEASGWNRTVYHIWNVTSDCGRSIARWCVWILVLILLFAWAYSVTGVSFGDGSALVGSLYYSVVTLTTLGYGDIVPRTSPARILAMIQVFMGYLMLGGLLSIFANKMARRAE
jgi:uncharacterized protein YjbI with pentapeptide repeats